MDPHFLYLHPGEGEGFADGGGTTAGAEGNAGAEGAAGAAAVPDHYKLFTDIPDGDERYRKALEVRRTADPAIRAAFDTMTQHIVGSRLTQQGKKFEGKLYGEADVQAKVNEALAKAKADFERANPAATDKEVEEYLAGIDETQRPNVSKLVQLFTGKLSKAEQRIADFEAKENDKAQQATTAEQNKAFMEAAGKIHEKIPTVDPLTIVDVLRQNAAKPEGERMSEPEIMALMQEIEDERFSSLLPARLRTGDGPTGELLTKTVLDGVAANEPWASELVTKLLDGYEEAKRRAPAGERPGLPGNAGTAAPGKWDPDEARRG